MILESRLPFPIHIAYEAIILFLSPISHGVENYSALKFGNFPYSSICFSSLNQHACSIAIAVVYVGDHTKKAHTFWIYLDQAHNFVKFGLQYNCHKLPTLV